MLEQSALIREKAEDEAEGSEVEGAECWKKELDYKMLDYEMLRVEGVQDPDFTEYEWFFRGSPEPLNNQENERGKRPRRSPQDTCTPSKER